MELRRSTLRRFTLPMMAALLFVASGPASAQTTYGLIEGSISDATGGALSGATVTVTQPQTGFVRTIVTNERGLYRALNLNPAEYDVTVERRGFATVTRRFVKVDVGQAVALNLAMAVDTLAVVVSVAPPAPAINARTPAISNTIDTRRVNELPLNGRDFTRLALFAPGVVQTVGLIASIAVMPPACRRTTSCSTASTRPGSTTPTPSNARNPWCRPGTSRTWRVVGRRPALWMEAHRHSRPKEFVPEHLNRKSQIASPRGQLFRKRGASP